MTLRQCYSLTACCLAASLSVTSDAQEYVGPATGLNAIWEDAANWDGGELPDNDLSDGTDLTFIGGSADGTTPIGTNSAEVSLSSDQTVFQLRIGTRPGSTGTLNHSAGALQNDDWFFMGINAGPANGLSGPADGTYNLSGTASTNIDGNVALLGADDAANSAVVNVADNASFTANEIFLGLNSDADGEINVSGSGTLQSDVELRVGGESGGDGTLGVSDSAIVNADINGINLGFGDGASGLMSVTGSDATITTASLVVGGNIFGALADTAPSTGILAFFPDVDGVSPIISSGDVIIGQLNGDTQNTAILGGTLLSPATILPMGDIPLIEVGGGLAGEFSNAPEGTLFGGGTHFITYAGGDGNDVVLAAVIPEPATVALLGLTTAAALLRRRV